MMTNLLHLGVVSKKLEKENSKRETCDTLGYSWEENICEEICQPGFNHISSP